MLRFHKICKNYPQPALRKVFNYSGQTPYPYKFGGVNIDHLQIFDKGGVQLAKFLFGDQLESSFSFAYKEALGGLADDDVDFLKTIMEPRVVKGLRRIPSEGLQLINQDAKIQTKICRPKIIIQLPIIRPGLDFCRLKLLTKNNSSIDLYKAEFIDNRIPKLTVLFSFQTIFTSSIKLRVKNSNQEHSQLQKQEHHVVQFQTQVDLKQFSPFAFIRQILYSRIFGGKGFQIFLKDYLAEHQSGWQIADIDQVLEGNLPMIEK